MKMNMKPVISAALAAIIIIGTVTAHAATANTSTNLTSGTNSSPEATMAALFGDPVIAKGKGFEIKRSDLDDVMLGIKSAIVARGETIPPGQITNIEATMLNRLVQIQILLQKATEADKTEGKKKADMQVATLLERAGSEELFTRQLTAVGMTPEELRMKITQEAIATATLTRELGITVLASETKAFYDTHPADFEQPESARARHILLMTVDPLTRTQLSTEQQNVKRKQIDDLLKRIRAGEDFATLAKQYSEDVGSKEKGGELPAFPRGQMVPEFEAAVFAMKTNTVSDVVTSAYGYHIIKLIEKIPAKKVDYATVTERIREYLTQQKVEKAAIPYLIALKKSVGVEILDPALKTISDTAEAAAATNAPARLP